jgi:hypothetical protein
LLVRKVFFSGEKAVVEKQGKTFRATLQQVQSVPSGYWLALSCFREIVLGTFKRHRYVKIGSYFFESLI